MIYEYFFAVDEWMNNERRYKFKGFVEANTKREAIQRMHYLQHIGCLSGRCRISGLGFHKTKLLGGINYGRGFK